MIYYLPLIKNNELLIMPILTLITRISFMKLFVTIVKYTRSAFILMITTVFGYFYIFLIHFLIFRNFIRSLSIVIHVFLKFFIISKFPFGTFLFFVGKMRRKGHAAREDYFLPLKIRKRMYVLGAF